MQKMGFAIISSLLCSASMAYTFPALSNQNCKWTGYYAGANIGLVNHAMDLTDRNATTFFSTLHQVSNPSLTGGLQAGYRRQVDFCPVSGVYGVEVSTYFTDASFDKLYGSPFALYQLRSRHQLNNISLLEGIGGIAVNRTFLFLAAGFSWVSIAGKTRNLDSIAFFDSFSVDQYQFGTALGAGLEYLICDNMSLRFKVDVITPTTYSVRNNTDSSFEVANNIVQGTLGINYKFA